ncbi:hypothetical protein [Nostoc sp. 106C]|uniref:hypothetical protein n=1 Tax=Nostoc sp. 106C TaxID=1932667 RepID=UPI001180EBA0|nr:hypothetical protein [Nostoc sp. 106C]
MLADPLTFKKDSGKNNPIWWYRGYRNLQIESFEHLENNIVLINEQELQIKQVIAVNTRDYYQCFIYIETFPMEPSGLYNWEKREIQRMIEQYGYYNEEFGVYQREFFVTRSEYDDGAATINGKLVELDWRATELRVRYLSPYNLIIAASESPINNPSFDNFFEKIMNNILGGNANIEDLNRAVLELPKRSNI